MARLVSFCVLVGILVVIGVLFYHVIANFILPMFLATLLVVIFHPLHRWFLAKTKDRHYVAAALTTAAVMAIVLVPFVLVSTIAISEATSMATKINVATVRDRLAETRASLGLEIPHAAAWRQVEAKLTQALLSPAAQPTEGTTVSDDFGALLTALETDDIVFDEDEAQQVRASLDAIALPPAGSLEQAAAAQKALGEVRDFKRSITGGPLWLKELANPSDEDLRDFARVGLSAGKDSLVSAAGNTTAFLGKTLVGLIIMVVAMFFFFADGPKMIEHFMELAPLDRGYERELLVEFDRVSRAVVVATLLSAVVQGLLAGVGYAFAGMESVFLLTLLTTVFAMVPFFGAASIWVPVSLWLYFYEDRPVAAICLAIYGAAVVSMIDNVIKPWVLHGQSNLHPLAALLSVLGGVQALGPIGILVGPMVFVFLATLLKILQRELKRMETLPWNVKGK